MPQLCPTELRTNLSYTRDYILIANFIAMVNIAIIIVFAIDTQMRLNCYINYRVSIYMPASSFSHNANTFKVGLNGGGEAP